MREKLLDKIINYFKFINYTYMHFYAKIKAGIVTGGIMWYTR